MMKIQHNFFSIIGCFFALFILSGCGPFNACKKKKASCKQKSTVALPKDHTHTIHQVDNQTLSPSEDIEPFTLADLDEMPFYDAEEIEELVLFDDFPLELEDINESTQHTFNTLYYGYDKNLLTKNQRHVLEENMDQLMQPVQEGKTIVIKTNRCVCGAESYNKTLSDQAGHYLAEEIRCGLAQRGINEDNISIKVVGMGSEEAQLIEDATLTLAQRKKSGDEKHADDRWAQISVQTI